MKLSYEAFDKSGNMVCNALEATDVADARTQLQRRGLFVAHIGGRSVASSSKNRPKHRKRGGGSRTRRLKHLAIFARQMYVLVSSGTRIVEALETLQQQVKDEQWRNVIGDIQSHVEEGLSLSEAVGLHPHYFDPVSVNLIAAGESTGKLSQMLDRLAKLTQKQVQIRGELVGAMIYPALLLCVSLSVLTLMLLFVVPRFTMLFQTLDVALPPTTAILLWISQGLRAYWWVLILGTVGSAVGLHFWIKSPSGKRAMDTLVLRIPHLGRMTRNFATARIARLLGIMLDSYMPLLDVLGLIRQTMSNGHYAKLLGRAEEAVTRGEPISSTFTHSDLINPSVAQVMRSGEQSGQVAPLLLNVADLLDEENEVIIKSLTSILEPVILVLLGLLVGFVALSMFLPLFDVMGGQPGGG